MTVRQILEAAREAGYDSRRTETWTALVVLTETESGGDPDKVSQHFAKAKKWPQWSPGDLVKYASIPLRHPGVLLEMTDLGIDVTKEAAGEAAGEAVEAISEPIVEVARLPLRVLQWLTDPGTILRVAKVVGGGLLIIGGLYLVAKPAIDKQAGKLGQALAATPQGRGAKVAATAAAAKGGSS